jgi:hypothetical protein
MKIKSEPADINKLLPLHYNEINLIQKMRESYRYGELTIIVQDGIPLRIRKGIVGEDLSQKDEGEKDV